MKKLWLKVTVTVDYTCSEFDVQQLKDNLRGGIQSLYDEGVLTGDTETECNGIVVSAAESILLDHEETGDV